MEEIAEAVSALRSTAVIATARGFVTATTAAATTAICRTSVVAGVRIACVAVSAAGLELLHHLGFSRFCDHQHCGHRNGEKNKPSYHGEDSLPVYAPTMRSTTTSVV
jgi:hypothetical protein